MWVVIYKPYELIDGRTMWERVQVDEAVALSRKDVSSALHNYNIDREVKKQRWVRILVASPMPPRFMFREELTFWPKPGQPEVLPNWELRL